MGWNRSEHYAISVGRLADRIAGAGQLHRKFPDNELVRFSTQQIIALQTELNRRGFDTGKPDGVIGPATRKAIQKFQHKNKLIADGYPDAALLKLLASKSIASNT